MNKIKIFEHSEFGQIRTVQINGEIYFAAKDVISALGYWNSKRAWKKHVPDESKFLSNCITVDCKKVGIIVTNETGLRALIYRRKTKKALRFEHWVMSEIILPAWKQKSCTVQLMICWRKEGEDEKNQCLKTDATGQFREHCI